MDEDYGYDDCGWERDDDYNVFEENCLDADRAAGEFEEPGPDDGAGYCRSCDEWHDDLEAGLCFECGSLSECERCGGPEDDSCMGCPEYARKASKMDPGGVYSAAGECIGRTDEPILY